MGTIILILQKRNLRSNLYLLTCFYSLNIFPRKRIFIYRTLNFFKFKFKWLWALGCFSCCLFVTLWTVVHQAPLSTGFSQQECWSGLPHPPPRDLSHPGIKLVSLASPSLADRFFIIAPPGKPIPTGNNEEESMLPGWGGRLGVGTVFPVNFILNLKHMFRFELCSPYILEHSISPFILLHFGSSVSWCS